MSYHACVEPPGCASGAGGFATGVEEKEVSFVRSVTIPGKGPLKIRRARASDRESVLEFCRFTWPEHGDYIDKVWDDWLKDKRGFLAVASIGGKPVATAKLTVLSPGQCWLEGLRVMPAFRGVGMSRIMTRFLLGRAKDLGGRTVRFATGEDNRASKHVGRELGFRLLTHYSIMRAHSDGRRRRVFDVMTDAAQSPREIARIVSLSSFARAMGGLASSGWTFFQVDGGMIAEHLQNRQLFLGTLDGAIGARIPLGVLVASRNHGGRRLDAKLFADAAPDALGPMFLGARKLAQELDLPQVRAVVPKSRKLLRLAREAGFQEEDPGFYHCVMEKRLRHGRGSRSSTH
jgi:GNAT superfamily N-acetyltransferase